MSEIDDLIAQADGVMVHGKHVERIYQGGTMVRDSVTNYAPKIEGSGTWVEVRRNLCAQPMLSQSISMWQNDTNGTLTSTPDGALVEQSVASSGTWGLRMRDAGGANITGGTTMYAAMKVTNVGTTTVGMAMCIRSIAGEVTQSVSANRITLAPGQTGTISHEWTTPAASTRVIPLVHLGYASSWPVGSKILFHDYPVLCTPGFVPVSFTDPDMRVRFLGAENASENVLEIESPVGYRTNRCIAGAVMRDGKPIIRLIPTSPDNSDSFAYLPVPELVQGGGVMIGTSHSPAPLTGTISAYPLSLRVLEPNHPATRPNDATRRELRSAFGQLTVGMQARIYHGGRIGSGDVYWDGIALVPGTYTGPPFDGDTPGAWWLPDGTSRMLAPAP